MGLYPTLLVQQGRGPWEEDVRCSDFRFDNPHLEIGAQGDVDPDWAGATCLDFAHGPHNIIQNPPCGSTCGTPLVPGFEVFENEAYLVNCIAGSEYTVSFCNGYNPATWDAVITVGLYDGAGSTVQDSDIAFSEGCSLTFTTPTSDTYVIVISGFENCGGSLTNTNNGVLMIDCGPNGASCTETTSNEDIFLAEDIRIIPNPSMGDSRISLPEGVSGEVLLKISDRTGKMVFQKTFDQISEGQLIIKKSWLETGLYIVSLLHEGNVNTVRHRELQRGVREAAPRSPLRNRTCCTEVGRALYKKNNK